MKFVVRSILSLFVAAPVALAGTYGPQNFESFQLGATALGDGSTIVNATAGVAGVYAPVGGATPKALRLTATTTGSNYGAWKLPVLDALGEVTSFDASFKCQQYNTGNIADGFTFNFGAVPGGTDPGSGETGFSMANGMFIAFDTYNNGGDAPQIRVYANGVLIGAPYAASFPVGNSAFHSVVIHWDGDGLDMTYNGAQVFLNRQLPGFVPAQGNIFAFSARTGGVTQDTYIDDVQITTGTQPPLTTSDVVITEFLADNGDGIEDENNDSEDWVELYNGTASPVNLNGWRLTNVIGNNALWTFPAVSIPSFSYLRVFASGKNRTTPVLHTNFTLPKEGGYLALVKPDGTTITSEFNYPQQSEDVSYGGYGIAQDRKFMIPPTPAGKNEVLATSYADGRPSEEVIFSREGGIITGTVQLGVTAPLDPAAVIRYSTDGTVPTGTSPVFNPATPLNISTSTQIRARTFVPGRLPGDVSSRVFLLLDASLASYATTGQPFKSNLPIIVVESWGVNIDAVTNPSGPRPHRPIYSVVINKDPLAGNLASITALPDFQGRGGMHVRGQTSASFGQKPFAWEVWTNEDQDKSVPLLGMPADGDWVLQTIYNDKTGMRNILPQTLMQETNGIGAGVRSRFVEVFFNMDGGPISYADYRGVYVLMEHIERGADRIDISKLSPLATDPAVITGGYVFKRDKVPKAPVYTHTSTSAWGSQTHEITEPDTASAAQVSWLQSHVQAFDNALSGANFADPVLGYKGYIEPQTFMDNHQWVEVFKQIDGYRLSTYYTKNRGQKIRALPIWDYNLSGGNGNYGGPLNNTLADNPVGWYYNNCNASEYPYYPRLFTDTDFRNKYWDRYWKLRRGVFATSYIHGKIDAWANELTNNQYATNVTNGVSVATGSGDFFPTNKGNNLPPSMETPSRLESPIARHFDRWPVLGVYVWPNPAGFGSRTTFQSEVQWMKDWFTNRLVWIDSQSVGGKAPDFSSYGGNVSSGTPLTMTNPNASGTIYYTTDGSDPNTPTQVMLVPENSPSVWLVPSAANGGTTLTAGAGANQWTNVAAPPNIANWTSSNAALGYDANAGTDYLPHIAAGGNTQALMQNINRSCYVRITFNIPDAAALANIGSLLLQAKYDDGYRAYINGVQVGGKNHTHSSMTTNVHFAQASLGHADAAAILFETEDITTLGKPQLVVGTNVLAVHALAVELSGDFLFAPRLAYTLAGSSYTGPVPLVNSTTVKARVFAGGQWSPLTEASFVVGANPASSSNLVVSEICYNPPASGIYASKDLEYIALRNITAGNVDLTGVQFTNGITHPLAGTPQQLTLPPGGEVIIAGNPTALAAVHGAAPPGVLILGPYDGALDNSGETLSLRTASGAVIKEFTYSILPPWPAGASIVLEHPFANPDHAVGYNWRLGNGLRGTPYSNDSVTFAGAWDADSDGDGLADGLEYSLGSDASSPASTPQIGIAAGTETVGMATGTFLRITFRRSLGNDTGTTLPELSTDLMQPWQTGTDVFERILVTNNGDGTSTETWRTKIPLTSPQAFARIKATSP
jgi:CotH kinase protein/Lamin Tail Domain/Chitobiase/beta-hexosaminidase C-terminal domain